MAVERTSKPDNTGIGAYGPLGAEFEAFRPGEDKPLFQALSRLVATLKKRAP
jgi:hypothetical protein